MGVLLVGYIESPVVLIPMLVRVRPSFGFQYVMPAIFVVYAPLNAVTNASPALTSFYGVQFEAVDITLETLGWPNPEGSFRVLRKPL